MKLLLTSEGLSNASIVKALRDLTERDFEELNVAFIPTASTVEAGNKDWVINDLVRLTELKFKVIDIVDISAISQEMWQPRLEQADILFFEGGNNFHLMRWINKSGLKDLLPELLKTKVWVGISAGSMVTCPDLVLPLSQAVYEEDLTETENMEGLNFVPFYVLPHLNSDWFKKVREEPIKEASKELSQKVYALDDNSALKVVDGIEEVVSEGEWLVFNS